MAPEYGATMGFFPVDEKTVSYFEGTGRTPDEIAAFEAYFRAQGLFGVPKDGAIDYSSVVTLDLTSVAPSLAGPKRPQDRIEIGNVKKQFASLFSKPAAENGFNQPAARLNQRFAVPRGDGRREGKSPEAPVGAPRDVEEMTTNRPLTQPIRGRDVDEVSIADGDVLIAAITSCTNTSNPSVLLAAGLMAKKAVERGLTVKKHIKTSLAPGSRIVTEYLTKTGLLPYLEKLGFAVAAYGCTTCIGNAGDLAPEINEMIIKNNLVCAAVLSGNRNFEARIHPNLKANFLASPPLVVAYAIAGSVLVDLMTEPLGRGKNGKEVWIGDIWPTSDEIYALMKYAMDPEAFAANYSKVKADPGELWKKVGSVSGNVYTWPKSTYIARPPFFDGFSSQPAAAIPPIRGARALGIFGDSITTDHISPAGSIAEKSPAGQWLIAHGVPKAEFNSYGARRGNHEVMMRGTFANVRIKNLMLPALADGSRVEGGHTVHQPSGERMWIYDAAMKYIADGVPTMVFGGEEYGTGSSRDWAAKGTQLLGVKAVAARSFERIHRSNLVGMGVLPLQFVGNDSVQSLGLVGDETFDIEGIESGVRPQQDVTLVVNRKDGSRQRVAVKLRIDTPIEVDYYMHGGILPYVLRQLLAA
jgi:aconitate hydratase